MHDTFLLVCSLFINDLTSLDGCPPGVESTTNSVNLGCRGNE